MPWDDATLGHLRKWAMAGKNFALAIILVGLAPGGVGVHMVEDHDVAVAKAGDERGRTCLAFVHCVLQINEPDEDVMCNNVCSWRRVAGWRFYVGGVCVVGGTGGINEMSGSDALALSLHVTHLSFL
jgi:hypothetical protein